MQAVFYERENRLSSSQERQDSRNDSKVITRRQDRRSSNMFKKKKEEEEDANRDRRSQSSHLIKFVKHQSASQRDDVPTDNQALQSPNPNPKHPNPNSPSKPTPKKSLVFNKFTHHHKQQIRDHMSSLKQAIDNQIILQNPNQLFLQIEAYISKMQDNNSKLLQVNYFFQKEFNELMAEKQLAKRMEKCSKNYCLECRYHLEKENRWKQEKLDLESQITKLKDQLSSVQSSKIEDSSKNISISQRSVEEEEIIMRQSILKMREELQQKDEEYLILLKEFNYLDSINKDLKQKLSKTMQEYKYLSIENRTLLNMKTKVIQKQLECTKYKEERDYFKKKMIDNHRKSQAELRASCKCAINKGDQSIFSLSSVSNQEHNTSSIVYLQELQTNNTTQFS